MVFRRLLPLGVEGGVSSPVLSAPTPFSLSSPKRKTGPPRELLVLVPQNLFVGLSPFQRDSNQGSVLGCGKPGKFPGSISPERPRSGLFNVSLLSALAGSQFGFRFWVSRKPELNLPGRFWCCFPGTCSPQPPGVGPLILALPHCLELRFRFWVPRNSELLALAPQNQFPGNSRGGSNSGPPGLRPFIVALPPT